MEQKEIENLVELRQKLIMTFSRLRDYKSNKNAIMKERDHAQILHESIVSLDEILKNHVSFSDKK
jgi:hypothetical protein